MEQSLADKGDGEQLIETKVVGVQSTYSQLRPSQLCLYCVIWTLMEQSLGDSGDGEELIETKVGGVHSMVSRLQPSDVWL